jgi:hypothetical protein
MGNANTMIGNIGTKNMTIRGNITNEKYKNAIPNTPIIPNVFFILF